MVKIVETKLDFYSPIAIYDVEIINDISVPDSAYWNYEEGDICVAGFLIGNKIIQIIHEHNGDTIKFKNELNKILENRDDLWAYNFRFEHGVTRGILKKDIFISEVKPFKGKGFSKDFFFDELVKDKKINKKEIPKDPFNGDGNLSITRWKEGKVGEILEHNRACLIKEYFVFIFKQYLLDKYKSNINEMGWYEDKNELATPKQISYLNDLGIMPDGKMTKAEASKLIEENKRDL